LEQKVVSLSSPEIREIFRLRSAHHRNCLAPHTGLFQFLASSFAENVAES